MFAEPHDKGISGSGVVKTERIGNGSSGIAFPCRSTSRGARKFHHVLPEHDAGIIAKHL